MKGLLRAVRLSAMADAPSAFASSFDVESHRPAHAWDADAAAGSAGSESADYVVESDTMELVSMWVAPDARAQGLGARLVEQVVEWAREGAARRIALWVMRRNRPAIALYERGSPSARGGGARRRPNSSRRRRTPP